MKPELDKLQLFPDEATSGCNGECVGFTRSDIVGNIIGQPCDLEYAYASGLWMSGSEPTTAGEDFYAGMAANLVVGDLLVSEETFNAQSKGQLYDANFSNYPADQVTEAQKNSMGGVSYLNSYAAIDSYLAKKIAGVPMVMQWYESFMVPNSDGTLPAPSGTFTEHCVGIWQSDSKGLLLKPYVNPGNIKVPTWGINGYCYLTEANYNLVNPSALGFNTQASALLQWISLVQLWLAYPAARSTIWPLL